MLTSSPSRPSGVANQTDILIICQEPSKRNKQQAWRTGLDNVGLVWIQGSFKRHHAEGGRSGGGGDGSFLCGSRQVKEQFNIATKTEWTVTKITMGHETNRAFEYYLFSYSPDCIK